MSVAREIVNFTYNCEVVIRNNHDSALTDNQEFGGYARDSKGNYACFGHDYAKGKIVGSFEGRIKANTDRTKRFLEGALTQIADDEMALQKQTAKIDINTKCTLHYQNRNTWILKGGSQQSSYTSTIRYAASFLSLDSKHSAVYMVESDAMPASRYLLKGALETAKILAARRTLPDTEERIFVGPVTFFPMAAAVLVHEIIGHIAEEDARDLSLWRKGSRLTNTNLTVFDDPYILSLPGSYSVDDQGIRPRCTTIIENGIVNDRITTDINGIENSTGNARMASPQEAPLCRMSNIAVAPGIDRTSALLKSSILVVERIERAGVDWENGRCILEGSGYMGKDGRILSRCGQILIAHSIESLFHHLLAVGDQTYICPGGWCRKNQGRPLTIGQIAPILRFDNIKAIIRKRKMR